MLIKLKCYVSGPRYTYKTGQEVDHPDEKEARRWIEAGVAEAVTPSAASQAQPEPEAAVQKAPERAVSRRRARTTRPMAH